MSNHIKIWIDDLDAISSGITEAFGILSSQQLNYKPNASTWSIAQIIEHLESINTSYFSTFENLLAGRHVIPWTGKLNFVTRFFGKTILKSVQPDNVRKTNTLQIWEPSTSNIDFEVLANFDSSQQALKEYIVKMKDLIDEEVVISSPANKFVVYTLPAALDIIVTHEKRHLNQANALVKR